MADATGTGMSGGASGGTGGWEFTDDRGAASSAARRPERVLAYVRAGAALLDLGVRPVAVYGSAHDGELPDPVKAGGLAEAGVPYLGAGRALDEARVRERAGRVDLVVDVTYDGKSPYALDEELAGRLGVPLVTLSVGGEHTLSEVVARFGELAGALGAAGTAGAATGRMGDAEAALRAAAGQAGLGVLALSGAGPEQVHLARPHAWPELARLAELGVRFVDPGPGPGASWLTTDWEHAVGLAPGLVLFDSRANAVPPQVVPPGARLAPWNPETPPSPAAYARFFQNLTAALENQP
ncbi:ABC transporter substrate-binding protein [Streptomyces roseicoloratus]|uniref:ABC transporter substrate-binding protein n=1 Tax=Streptomyces roseicoloratus TaxID=2508722 RepID=A0ABY9RZB5_9ACTN|nr:ABC transporter substrate-binding protein [Streptomyces roseicoloratus]WMX46514.1 ABC transporter substrate-binding protein [Streptomyces roseicoloratus]